MNAEDRTFLIYASVTAAFAFVIWFLRFLQIQSRELDLSKERLQVNLTRSVQELRNLFESSFLTQPCSRCHETRMTLIDISPNARSIQYKCCHCAKKMRAAATSDNSEAVIDAWNNYAALVPEARSWRMDITVEFETVKAPLPFEQTRREPIAEAVRTEVWRRDRGTCVTCGSRENLQFDHIIPVSRGGATSVANLQLLCAQCNRRKGATI